jgi:ribosomal protein S18 acetylase RimI-like enzyme
MSIRARARLEEHWIDVVFASVGIIQGLAFGKLAEQMAVVLAAIEPSFAVTGPDIEPLLLIVVCMALVCRVFQTYISVVLDYGSQTPKFSVVFGSFGVGALQYYIFQSIEPLVGKERSAIPGAPTSAAFYFRLLILALFGLLMYFLAYRGLKGSADAEQRIELSSPPDHAEELRLQTWNMRGVVAIGVLAAAESWWPNCLPSFVRYFVFPLTITLVFVLNINYSIGHTFERGLSRTRGKTRLFRNKKSAAASQPAAAGQPVGVAYLGAKQLKAVKQQGESFYKIRPATHEDADAIATILIDNFYYVYSYLLNCSDIGRVERSVLPLIQSNSRRMPFSWKYWTVCEYASYDQKTGYNGTTVAAMLTSVHQNRFGLSAALQIFYKLGSSVWAQHKAKGLLEFRRRASLFAKSLIPLSQGVLQIDYLAVDGAHRRAGIAHALVNDAHHQAREYDCKQLRLTRRDSNSVASSTFGSVGFMVSGKPFVSDVDSVFGLGPQVVMLMKTRLGA